MKTNTYFRPDEVIEQNVKIKVVKETIKPKPQQQLPSEFYVS